MSQKTVTHAQIADALKACSWEGVPIGQKAIIQQAIEALKPTNPPEPLCWMSYPLVGSRAGMLFEVKGPDAFAENLNPDLYAKPFPVWRHSEPEHVAKVMENDRLREQLFRNAQERADHLEHLMGEPVLVEAVGRTRLDEEGCLDVDWFLEGGLSALEHTDVLLLVAHGNVVSNEGSGTVFRAPDEDVDRTPLPTKLWKLVVDNIRYTGMDAVTTSSWLNTKKLNLEDTLKFMAERCNIDYIQTDTYRWVEVEVSNVTG